MVIFDGGNERENIAEIAKRYNLKVVALFGSQATGNLHVKSDIDIAVMGSIPISLDKKLELIDDFSNLFKCEDVELVDLRSASPTLSFVVVRDGKLLYEADADYFLKWKLYAIRVWMETTWLRNLRDRRLIEWAAQV